MNVHAVRAEADLVVSVHGHLVVGTRHLLHEAVAPTVAQGVRRVVVDFHETPYIDSTGLGTLAALARLLREQGGSLRTVGMIAELRNACTVAKLDGVLTHHESVDAALAAGVPAGQRASRPEGPA